MGSVTKKKGGLTKELAFFISPYDSPLQNRGNPMPDEPIQAIWFSKDDPWNDEEFVRAMEEENETEQVIALCEAGLTPF
jgi:hypothetical protein